MFTMFRVAMSVAMAVFLAAPALSLTLDDAVREGLKNNHDMQAFRLEEETAKGQMTKAKLPPFSNPIIEGSLSTQNRPPGEPGGSFRNNQINLSQSVEIAGQRGLRIDAATNNLERVRFDIRNIERTLRSEIRDAFAQTLFLRDRETLMREYLRLQEDLADLVTEKFEAGDVAALEVNLSQVELARAQKEVIAVATEYKNALQSLKRLIGMSPDQTMTVEGDLTSGLPSLPAKETLVVRITERPDVKAAEAETKRSQASEKLVVREMIPNVTWGIFQGRVEDGTERGATLSTSIPLFDRKQGERIEAKAKLSQARIRENSTTRTARKEFEESYTTAASSQKELDLFKRAILDRSTENLKLLQIAFKEGKISFYDLRIAQRETIETRNSYLQTLLTAQRAFNALERAIGGELR